MDSLIRRQSLHQTSIWALSSIAGEEENSCAAQAKCITTKGNLCNTRKLCFILFSNHNEFKIHSESKSKSLNLVLEMSSMLLVLMINTLVTSVTCMM